MGNPSPAGSMDSEITYSMDELDRTSGDEAVKQYKLGPGHRDENSFMGNLKTLERGVWITSITACAVGLTIAILSSLQSSVKSDEDHNALLLPAITHDLSRKINLKTAGRTRPLPVTTIAQNQLASALNASMIDDNRAIIITDTDEIGRAHV